MTSMKSDDHLLTLARRHWPAARKIVRARQLGWIPLGRGTAPATRAKLRRGHCTPETGQLSLQRHDSPGLLERLGRRLRR